MDDKNDWQIFSMVGVFTELLGLDLESGLKQAIAEILLIPDPAMIPLSLSFQRSGLSFRSALLLKMAAQHPPLSQHLLIVQRHFCDHHLLTLPEVPWQFVVEISPQGWLTFQLQPQDLAQWLDVCGAHLESLCLTSPLSRRSPRWDPFPWQYLHHRCHSLLAIAQAQYPLQPPTWHFSSQRSLPPEEQHLLEAIAQTLLALIQTTPIEKQLTAIVKAFWEYHRHLPLFALPQQEPALFRHHCRWLWLLEQLFHSYLHLIQVEPLTTRTDPNPPTDRA